MEEKKKKNEKKKAGGGVCILYIYIFAQFVTNSQILWFRASVNKYSY